MHGIRADKRVLVELRHKLTPPRTRVSVSRSSSAIVQEGGEGGGAREE